MADKTFSQVFNENMKAMSLPVPSTIYGTVATTLGTIGAFAGSMAKLGASATVAEIFVTIPVTAGGTAIAVAITEIVALCGGLLAAVYVGACIGSVIIAAYATLDVIELTRVASWLNEIADKLGGSVDEFLEKIILLNGTASPIRPSVVLAKKTSTTRSCC